MKKSLLSIAMLLISFLAYSQCPIPNLVAKWDFNGGSVSSNLGWSPTNPPIQWGSSAPGRDGSPNGARRLITGKKLVYASRPSMNLTSWTINMIIKVDDIYNAYCQTQEFIHRGTRGNNDYYGVLASDNPIDLNCTTYSAAEVFQGGAAGTQPFSDTKWKTDVTTQANINYLGHQWYCVTVMYDATGGSLHTGEISMYIDGVLYTKENWASSYVTSSADLIIGDIVADVYIDELRIYDGVFTCVADIADMCVCQMKPKMHWTFNGGSLKDDSLGLTGIINGGVTPAAGAAGIPNTAYQFNGTNGYIQVPYNPAMDLTSWTLAASVMPTGWYTGTCQVNSILWHAPNFSQSHYSLVYFENIDNLSVSVNCSNILTNQEVFAAFPAGTNPNPPAVWRGGGSNPFLSLNQWYCVWASYDASSGQLDLYVNGVLVLSQVWPNQYGTLTPSDLFFGSSNTPLGIYPYFMNGVIDDIAIYDQPISRMPNACLPYCTFTPVPPKPANINSIESTQDLIISPNPTSDQIRITMPDSWNESRIIIVNSIGKAVISKTTSNKTEIIDMGLLPPGIYTLRAAGANGIIITKKVIKN